MLLFLVHEPTESCRLLCWSCCSCLIVAALAGKYYRTVLMFLNIFFSCLVLSLELSAVEQRSNQLHRTDNSPLILNVQPWYIVIFMTICLSLYIKVTDTNRLAQFQCLHVCCWLCCPSVVTLWVTQYAQSMSIPGLSYGLFKHTALCNAFWHTSSAGRWSRRLHVGIWVNRCVCCSTGWKTSFLYKT